MASSSESIIDSEQSSEKQQQQQQQQQPKYRLHIYDHCPYCIRVELAFGWRNVHYERVLYGYGDRLGDESEKMINNPNTYDTGVVLTGKKELPVLEKINEYGNREWLKAESLDTIEWLEEHHHQQQQGDKYQPKSNRNDLKEFFKSTGRFKVVQRLITRPRMMKNMIHLKDWLKPKDRAYAIAKYESQGFDYTKAEAGDKESIDEMKILLEECCLLLLKSDTSFYENGILGWDDLLYLQELRTLSLVNEEDLIWPERLKNYVVLAFAKANNVHTYFK
jgi:glutaredoxin 2